MIFTFWNFFRLSFYDMTWFCFIIVHKITLFWRRFSLWLVFFINERLSSVLFDCFLKGTFLTLINFQSNFWLNVFIDRKLLFWGGRCIVLLYQKIYISCLRFLVWSFSLISFYPIRFNSLWKFSVSVQWLFFNYNPWRNWFYKFVHWYLKLRFFS